MHKDVNDYLINHASKAVGLHLVTVTSASRVRRADKAQAAIRRCAGTDFE